MIMKNVLVTGGCGFIGSNFLNYMVSKYSDINFYNLDIMYYCASFDNITVSDKSNYEFILGNINDYNLIVYLLQSKKIDTIVHFAAQSHVDNSFLESFRAVRILNAKF
jgi:dTDP-D-glucose 4,6-dehydratase